MKRIASFVMFAFLIAPGWAQAGDSEVFRNAFGETAAAYLNDSFLLLGTTADGYVAEIVPKNTALEIARNVQKRVRLIRAKLKTVSESRLSDVDRQFVGLLDHVYACMDHQAWALVQYVEEKSPETAKRFEAQRTDCLSRLKKLAEFYSALPPSPGLPEPLSTR